MNRVIDIVAQALSILLYPLFIPTYGVALFCYAFSIHVLPLPWVWTLVAVLGTFLLTCVLPLSAIGIMIRRGHVKDLEIAEASQRTMPYIYTTMSFTFWCYLLISILRVPTYLAYVAVGATVGIGLVALINKRWKISAHLTAFGGMFGGLMSYCLGIGAIPTRSTFVLWLSISLVLMYARVRLNAHTPAQVCAGWLMGIVCTFIPYCLVYYVV